MRRIWESVIATVMGGLIVWSLTGSMSRPAPATERMAATAVPIVPPTAAPTLSCMGSDSGPIGGRPETADCPNFRGRRGEAVVDENATVPFDARSNAPTAASIPGPTVASPLPKQNAMPYSVPVGSVLMYENFSRYREGDATDWGPNTFIKTGLDRRNWIVSNVDGAHTVGCRIRLPNEFSLECRYSAYMPEVTRGVFGWWKDPVSTKISFLNEQGFKYSIEWVVKCGNDPMRPNPLGSSSLYAKKLYHTIKLPDGAANEVGVISPNGVLRIDRDKNGIKVFVDGQPAATGTMNPMGQLVGFEIDVVKAANGTLFFTDFKIAR